MKYSIIFYLIFGLIHTANSQGISRIKLVDHISYPLKDNDNGISFSFFNSSYGNIGAFIGLSNKTYELFSNKNVIYGKGDFQISSNTLERIFTLNPDRKKAKIIMTHNSNKSNKYNSTELNFTVLVDAPYGSELKNYPDNPLTLNYSEKPDLYKTNNKKRKASGLAVLGITVGTGITIGGITVDNASIEGNTLKLSDEGFLLLIGGIALFSFSCNKLYYYEDDYYLNNYYSNLNDKALQNWNNMKIKIDRLNRIKMQNWEQEKTRIDKLNRLIINSVTIKFSF